MKELKDYMNRETWPGNPYGLKVYDLLSLTEISEELTDGLEGKAALHTAVMNTAMIAFACGFERGQRKAENAQKRARHSRREKEAAEGAETA